MKSEISFSLNGLALKGRQPEERLLLGQVAQTEGCATLLGDVRTNQIPDQLDYAHLGGCPVPLRSSLVRVVLFNIAATGIIAALVALASDSKNVWFPCALSAAVNGVAAVHYMLIWKIRAQNMPVPHMHMAYGHETDGSFVGNKTPSEQKEMELAKMFTQELSVDGLRCARTPCRSLFSQNLVDCIPTICVPCDPGTLTGRYAAQKPTRHPCTHPPPTHARCDVRCNSPGKARCFFSGRKPHQLP